MIFSSAENYKCRHYPGSYSSVTLNRAHLSELDQSYRQVLDVEARDWLEFCGIFDHGSVMLAAGERILVEIVLCRQPYFIGIKMGN